VVTLEVQGPFDVECWLNDRGTKRIDATHGREFFEENEWLIRRRGCYVFAIRSGRGLRAAYVGKATKGFGQEVFAVDKLNKYNNALYKWDHGSPVLLFVLTPPSIRSAPLITDVEEYLIRSVKRVWPDILNIHHTGPDSWDISGVTADHAGRRSQAESALAQLLKLDD
jgi:hypothetical protein